MRNRKDTKQRHFVHEDCVKISMYVGGTYLRLFWIATSTEHCYLRCFMQRCSAAAQNANIYSAFQAVATQTFVSTIECAVAVVSERERHRQHLVAAREVTDISQYEREVHRPGIWSNPSGVVFFFSKILSLKLQCIQVKYQVSWCFLHHAMTKTEYFPR